MKKFLELLAGCVCTFILVVVLIGINGMIGFNMKPALAYGLGGAFLTFAVIGIVRGIIKSVR